MHRRMNPREQKRMMQRMGMNMDSVADVQQVIIRTADKDIVIDEPEVAILQVQGQKMYQVIGGQVSEQAPSQRGATQLPLNPPSTKKTCNSSQTKPAKASRKPKKPSKNAEATWQKRFCCFSPKSSF